MLLKPTLSMQFSQASWAPHQKHSACFSYALNAPGLRNRNLGDLKELREPWRTYERIKDKNFIIDKAIEQGLIPVDEQKFDPSQEHIIATFTSVYSYDFEVYDCHHMRLDGDNTWSHKPGTKSPEKIIIPDGASISGTLLKEYSKTQAYEHSFISFFKIPKNGINVHERPGVPLP